MKISTFPNPPATPQFSSPIDKDIDLGKVCSLAHSMDLQMPLMLNGLED